MINLFTFKSKKQGKFCDYKQKSAYQIILDDLEVKAHSETQQLTFLTMKSLLSGDAEATKIKRLYSRNGELYEKRGYLCLARMIIRYGRNHGFVPVPKKYGSKMPFSVLASYSRPDLCPPLSTIAKMIGSAKK